MRYFVVDAFTSEPFKGNPAAVCLLQNDLPCNLMQKIASEFNLSETAFVFPKENGRFSLRWFTPKLEIKLCGHATLASAHVLWNENLVNSGEEILFDTLSGTLIVKQNDNTLELTLPIDPIMRNDNVNIELVKQSLRSDILSLSQSESGFLIAELENEELLRKIKPDFLMMVAIKNTTVIATTKSSDQNYDFVSRVFAPKEGIDEDPVTGSAHAALAPYWKSKLSKSKFKARQLSERGGEMVVVIENDRVLLVGNAVTTMNGEINTL